MKKYLTPAVVALVAVAIVARFAPAPLFGLDHEGAKTFEHMQGKKTPATV